MNIIDGIIIGFFIGVLVGGWFASWFIGRLKKNGYLKFELTDEGLKEFKKN